MQHQSRPKRRRSELQPLHFRGELFFLLLLLPLLRAGYLFPHSYCSSSSQVNGGAVCVRFFFPNVSFFFSQKNDFSFSSSISNTNGGGGDSNNKKENKTKNNIGKLMCYHYTTSAGYYVTKYASRKSNLSKGEV